MKNKFSGSKFMKDLYRDLRENDESVLLYLEDFIQGIRCAENDEVSYEPLINAVMDVARARTELEIDKLQEQLDIYKTILIVLGMKLNSILNVDDTNWGFVKDEENNLVGTIRYFSTKDKK